MKTEPLFCHGLVICLADCSQIPPHPPPPPPVPGVQKGGSAGRREMGMLGDSEKNLKDRGLSLLFFLLRSLFHVFLTILCLEQAKRELNQRVIAFESGVILFHSRRRRPNILLKSTYDLILSHIIIKLLKSVFGAKHNKETEFHKSKFNELKAHISLVI